MTTLLALTLEAEIFRVDAKAARWEQRALLAPMKGPYLRPAKVMRMFTHAGRAALETGNPELMDAVLSDLTKYNDED